MQDAKGFATCLLDFIGSNAQYLVSLMKMTSSDVDTSEQGQKDRLKHVEMTLETLYHVIHNNPGVEMQCIGHFKLLFTLLGVQGASKAQHLALKVHTAGNLCGDRQQEVCVQHCRCQCSPIPTASPLHASLM